MDEAKKRQFITLLEENKLLILRICRGYAIDHEDRKDLFQEVVINLWRSLPSFQGRSSISTWIYRIALNTCIRASLKYKTGNKEKIVLESISFEEIEDPARESQNEAYQQLYSCINTLPESDKSIVLLYLEDLPYADIALITGLIENHVAVKMKRIRVKLFDCLNQKS